MLSAIDANVDYKNFTVFDDVDVVVSVIIVSGFVVFILPLQNFLPKLYNWCGAYVWLFAKRTKVKKNQWALVVYALFYWVVVWKFRINMHFLLQLYLWTHSENICTCMLKCNMLYRIYIYWIW